MADDFALALQKGVRATLAANAELTAIVGQRIYDEPPQPVTYPYVRFNEIRPRAFDTDTTEGSEVDLSFDAYSRSVSGRVEAMQIAEAVKNALHRKETSITVTGFTLVEMIFENMAATRDSDGRGYTATVLLQATLEKI